MTPEERAHQALAPLFNQPHPLQEGWSPAHSMSLEALEKAVAEAIRAGRADALEEAAKIAERLDYFEYPGVSALDAVARAIRAKAKGETA